MDEQYAEHGGVSAERREKLAAWRDTGAAYPTRYQPRDEIGGLRDTYESLEPGQDADAVHRVAGRVIARREHGKLTFIVLKDMSGELQLFCQLDALGAERYEALRHVDLGDFVGAEGVMMRTRRGELSLRVTSWRLLSKSLRGMPEKYHGLTSVETRYRKRYLDLAANDDSREVFVKRARIIAAVRRFLDDRGFVEVETPILQPLYGGALARPFVTHHNQLDRDFYLRIATELYLKRCIVGGLERVYELGKDFRNEGVSFKHNPEFTMLEWYEAYADYGDAMRRLEELVARVAEACGYEGDLDFSPPWRRVTLRDAIAEHTGGIDILQARDRDTLGAAITAAGLEGYDTADRTWPQLVDDLVSKAVEPNVTDPVFIVDYPKELSPFAKDHRDGGGLVERFEAFVSGMEIANAFTELNDPDEQRLRFEQQARLEAEGDDEAQPYDEVFVQALEQGMPPTGGLGLGIDRLVMLMTGKRSIREIVLFPAMRD